MGIEELYPFLGEAPSDPAPVLAEVRASILDKSREIGALREETCGRQAAVLGIAADLLAQAFRSGRKALIFGNGGSATDARDLAADLLDPPLPGWRRLPAIDLTQDAAMLTAVGNDVGFASVFLRQVIAYGEAGDVAIGFSTSGRSANVLAGFEQARKQDMKKIGFAGGDGGLMAEAGCLDAVIVVPSAYIPRIQEAQATAYHVLLRMVQARLQPEEAG